MLFNEPKLLKLALAIVPETLPEAFSALQRAEIAEITTRKATRCFRTRLSVLFNEPKLLKFFALTRVEKLVILAFSALQRAEIAEISSISHTARVARVAFSALQRAEIAEIPAPRAARSYPHRDFQCSSTSRNC